ncbi:putative T7SS-secreted protein [Actinacidiphila paucisporea]|uniref:Putative T7SS secretion signal domain-containing protein n=1 Tax=Actinacidiphila paucisporea TaxID=310782 RepID=A0A1M7N3K0_9ACTN|nr:hypothetical protein [Actinacidiphila paucisporea]SHM97585.1 hypothetical protein SAMN05216499_117101 [Actinacidiphila paucisporea]
MPSTRSVAVWSTAADWVEDKGDHIADHLGAHVAEQQLGQSEEPDGHD